MSADQLARGIADLYRRFRRNELLPGDIVRDLPAGRMPASCMAWAYDTRLNGEPDAAPLGRLRREMGTILDCGAHWGYTALAIRLAGSDCPIISFEAYPGNTECLEELRRRDGSYDFVITGLGETASERVLYCPTVNGLPLTGLNCLDGGHIMHSSEQLFLVKQLGSNIPVAESYTCQLMETPIAIAALDDLVARHRSAVPIEPVAAIKLDLEGSELPALRGAARLLQRYAPLLMIEGANRISPVARFLRRLGYRYADIEGDQLRLTHRRSKQTNGFWLHPRHMAHYQAIGLVLPELQRSWADTLARGWAHIRTSAAAWARA